MWTPNCCVASILQGIAGAASVSSFGMVTDIERGYFDKLLLTPTPRLSLVLGRLASDGPLLFLPPAFAPKSVFAGWLKFLATINPVTYILEGMRSLILDGWEWERLAYACCSIAGLGAFTLTLTMLALRYRIR